ncbi:hypothetical protein HMPREF0682_2459 [Propionibacterium acidifaciens F0233]|uniref:Uncharacterized protein n=1 Tax=Propionibacterium acidifaciens F0233 TaxID=553198 RepID=U2QEI5_9ACTN|nr:hypothetical protein HMPREF0682_2459 [Propionibacterium acidifaciens F0233]
MIGRTPDKGRPPGRRSSWGMILRGPARPGPAPIPHRSETLGDPDRTRRGPNGKLRPMCRRSEPRPRTPGPDRPGMLAAPRRAPRLRAPGPPPRPVTGNAQAAPDPGPTDEEVGAAISPDGSEGTMLSIG